LRLRREVDGTRRAARQKHLHAVTLDAQRFGQRRFRVLLEHIRPAPDQVQAAEQELGRTCSVGVGIPGTISRETGLVKNANSTWLNGQPLREDLERTLGRPAGG
jgi:hypothetical protein